VRRSWNKNFQDARKSLCVMVLQRRSVWRLNSFDDLIDRFEASSQSKHDQPHTCCQGKETNEQLLIGDFWHS
jgi:hypothetical protein